MEPRFLLAYALMLMLIAGIGAALFVATRESRGNRRAKRFAKRARRRRREDRLREA